VVFALKLRRRGQGLLRHHQDWSQSESGPAPRRL